MKETYKPQRPTYQAQMLEEAKSKRKTAIWITVIITLGAVMAVYYLTGANTKGTDVYAICMAARSEVSGQSEQACGQAQDATNTEFLCSKDGSSCWVETK